MGLDAMQLEMKLIRDTEAADILGCARSTFWRWVSAGIIPQPIKIGGMSRWYLSEIERTIAAAAQKSRAPKAETPIRVRTRCTA
jgi:predicted DNA-binding transcriptional regulator AlpA